MTMAAYGMRGTPTTLAFDRCGRLARHSFSAEDDLALGMLLGWLVANGLGATDDAGTMLGASTTD